MDDKEILFNLLKDSDLFNSLNDTEINKIVNESKINTYSAETKLINQWEFGDKLCFIIRGEVEISVINKQGQDNVIATLGEGNYFGELGIIVDSVRAASVKTKKECCVCWIDKTHIDHLIKTNIKFCKALLSLVSMRLAKTLNVFSQKKSHLILLNYDGLNKNTIDAFENYFEQICPIEIIKTDVENLEHILGANTQKNAYYLIRNEISRNRTLSRTPEYTVNFCEFGLCDYALYENSSQWMIEHVARRITKKTIGIALASGGAPGLSHIGVLKEFKRQAVPLDFIVGTSAGALYGAIYAFGLEYEDILSQLRIETSRSKVITILRNLSFNFSGLMKSTHLKKILSTIFKDQLLESALIPFAPVASDLYSGKTVVIKTGNAVDAILSSNAAPLIIEPVKLGEHLLVDGVATDPLPVDVLHDEKIDIKVAVNIPQLDLIVSMDAQPKMTSVYLRTKSMMANQIVNMTIAKADIVIEPKIAGSRLMDWKSMDKYIEAGELAAAPAIEQIKMYLKKIT